MNSLESVQNQFKKKIVTRTFPGLCFVKAYGQVVVIFVDQLIGNKPRKVKVFVVSGGRNMMYWTTHHSIFNSKLLIVFHIYLSNAGV